MIDTWLSAALILFFIAVCTVIRVIPVPSLNDRLVAGTAAMTMLTAAALALGIDWRNLPILEAIIIIDVIWFAAAMMLMGREVKQP
jgi:multisubunit Na+/H+ antiporter MnhF subunit